MIGRVFGAQALGYYNRAFQLMLLPLNQINAPSTRVALPTLSRLQDQPARYGEFISFGQTVLLNIVSFVLGFSIAQASDVVAVALGPQWAADRSALPDPRRRGLLPGRRASRPTGCSCRRG